MKILFALRLYSGLENSVINEKWQPNGIPTIYKLLEDLDKKHDIKVLDACINFVKKAKPNTYNDFSGGNILLDGEHIHFIDLELQLYYIFIVFSTDTVWQFYLLWKIL